MDTNKKLDPSLPKISKEGKEINPRLMKRRGRPKKKPDDPKAKATRDEIIKVRVTVDERKQIAENMLKAGFTTESSYLRSRALNDAPVIIIETEDFDLLRKIKKGFDNFLNFVKSQGINQENRIAVLKSPKVFARWVIEMEEDIAVLNEFLVKVRTKYHFK